MSTDTVGTDIASSNDMEPPNLRRLNINIGKKGSKASSQSRRNMPRIDGVVDGMKG